MALKPEQLAMITIFDWVRWMRYDRFIWHTANERKATPHAGALLKRMGVKSGVLDITISKPSRGYHGAYIEVKVGKNKLTLLQKEFLEGRAKDGYYTEVIWGADEVIKRIGWYLHP